MADTALEGAPPLPAVLVGKEFEIADGCHVEQCCDGHLLLVRVGNAIGYGLEGCHVRLAKFEVCDWLRIDHLDRQPWEVAAISHAQSLISGLREW